MGLLKNSFYIAFITCGVYYFKQFMNGGVCQSQARLDGKVVVITGANTGIGKETAKELVLRGAKVYLACRSLERAQDTVQNIHKETGVDVDKLPIVLLDLSSLNSVREFVKQFTKKEDKLDILINNAGAAFAENQKTEDGLERTFGINHLGHFLLTHLLMDVLTSAPKSRIINVSALAHKYGTMNFDDLMLEKSYGLISAYCQSKLANILFTRELAKRLKGSGVTTYALHPGVLVTDLGRDLPLADTTVGKFLIYYLTWPIFKDSWHGAQTTICCAVDENLSNSSGKYYSDCQEKEPSQEAQDDDSAQKLWDISVKLVKLDPSETHSLLQ